MTQITMTERAADRIRALLAELADDSGYGLRVGVLSFGWTDRYRLSLGPGPHPDEHVVRVGGLDAFVPAVSARLVDGVRIDYVETATSAGFTFHRPRPPRVEPPPALSDAALSGVAPAGGSAPSRRDRPSGPADLWHRVREAMEDIRPVLWRDGGDAEVVAVADGTAWIRMAGACAGCAVSSVTLTTLIEHRLTEAVPEIVRVELAA